MNVIISFLAGAIAAIIASIPVGPITFAIIQATLNAGKKAGYMIAFGAIAVEIFFCVIAVFGLGSLIDEETIHSVMRVIAIPVLILLGVISLVKKEPEFKEEDRPTIKAHNFLLLGATLCFTNPIIVGYWLFISKTLESHGWLGTTFWDKTLFITGIVTGVIIFFSSVIYFTDWKKQSITREVRNKINIGLGLFFIAFGLYLGVRYIMEMMAGEPMPG